MMEKSAIIVGIDFDNTIVCYDSVFYDCAVEKELIPLTVPKTKNGVRDYLRQCGKEALWTELQGYVYGPGILKAEPFAGVLEFLEQCKFLGIKVYIISHKTKHPFIGEKYDLHSWALQWLQHHHFLDTNKTGLFTEDIFLELTKEEKIASIKDLQCTYFVDDLPEIFDHSQFPTEVKKILFNPQQKNDTSNTSNYTCIKSWKDINTIINTHNFLTKLRINYNSINRIPGGKNNQAFLIQTDTQNYFLKKYFYHPLDSRDRLNADFSFCSFLWKQGICSISRPYAMDKSLKVGLYQFVEGKTPTQEDISQKTIEQALAFWEVVNKHKNNHLAKSLPSASEACFSIAEHMACVEKRITKLKDIPDSSAINKEALLFVNNALIPLWSNLTLRINKDQRLNVTEVLSQQERCLSPSDFGFHNTLINNFGKLTFIDFEYAGWDDPAKMICDFFCQPALPVPVQYYDFFIKRIFEGVENQEQHLYRTKSLLPLYIIKWCCIMLNEFLKTSADRRQFASIEVNDEKKAEQLRKVKDYFNAGFGKHKL